MTLHINSAGDLIASYVGGYDNEKVNFQLVHDLEDYIIRTRHGELPYPGGKGHTNSVMKYAIGEGVSYKSWSGAIPQKALITQYAKHQKRRGYIIKIEGKEKFALPYQISRI